LTEAQRLRVYELYFTCLRGSHVGQVRGGRKLRQGSLNPVVSLKAKLSAHRGAAAAVYELYFACLRGSHVEQMREQFTLPIERAGRFCMCSTASSNAMQRTFSCVVRRVFLLNFSIYNANCTRPIARARHSRLNAQNATILSPTLPLV
jgi:hypothetical protein